MSRFSEIRPITPGAAARTIPHESSGGDWVGLGDASRMLGVSAGTLRRWTDQGRIPVFTTPGGHRRFSRRSLLALVPARRVERTPLAHLGASADRITRAYRRRPRQHQGPQELPWVGTLTDEERAAFRDRGRELVALLLAHLDETERPDATGRLDEALRVAAGHGRRMATIGISMTEGVQSFLQFRAPFVSELSSIARRRGLDTREATALLAAAEAALDRLLVATIEGYASADARGGAGVTGRAAARGGGLRKGAQSGTDAMTP